MRRSSWRSARHGLARLAADGRVGSTSGSRSVGRAPSSRQRARHHRRAMGPCVLHSLDRVTTERKLTARSVVAVGAARHRPAPPADPAARAHHRAVRHRRGHHPHGAVPHGRRPASWCTDGRRVRPAPAPPGRPPGPPGRQPGRPAPGPWPTAAGGWPSSAPTGRGTAADRAEVRAALAAARLAELREGVWLRPDNLDGTDADRRAPAPFRAPSPDDDPAALAAELWDLDGWAQRGRRPAAPDGRPRRPRSRRGDTGALARRLRRCRPTCCATSSTTRCSPTALLPAGWPGAALRADYDHYDAAYREVLATWFGRPHRAPGTAPPRARAGGHRRS